MFVVGWGTVIPESCSVQVKLELPLRHEVDVLWTEQNPQTQHIQAQPITFSLKPAPSLVPHPIFSFHFLTVQVMLIKYISLHN